MKYNQYERVSEVCPQLTFSRSNLSFQLTVEMIVIILLIWSAIIHGFNDLSPFILCRFQFQCFEIYFTLLISSNSTRTRIIRAEMRTQLIELLELQSEYCKIILILTINNYVYLHDVFIFSQVEWFLYLYKLKFSINYYFMQML